MYCWLGSFSPIEISYTSFEFEAWISNNIHIKLWNVITHPCPNFNSSLAKLLCSLAKLLWKLLHGWVITSHTKMWYVIMHALISYEPDQYKRPLVTYHIPCHTPCCSTFSHYFIQPNSNAFLGGHFTHPGLAMCVFRTELSYHKFRVYAKLR